MCCELEVENMKKRRTLPKGEAAFLIAEYGET